MYVCLTGRHGVAADFELRISICIVCKGLNHPTAPLASPCFSPGDWSLAFTYYCAVDPDMPRLMSCRYDANRKSQCYTHQDMLEVLEVDPKLASSEFLALQIMFKWIILIIFVEWWP